LEIRNLIDLAPHHHDFAEINSKMQTKPDLSILIVSYKTREMTLACIDSVIQQTRKTSYEIIVVDNASDDGTCEEIRRVHPAIKLLDSKENLGFALGNNIAAKMSSGSRLLLLNPDTLIIDGAIDTLVEFARNTPDAGIWGGKTIFPDHTINASCLRAFTPWSLSCRTVGLTWLFPRSRLFNPESIHKWCPFDAEMSVDIVVGCFLLIDRDIWTSLEGFDERFFMYGEESDLCLRAKKIGASPRIEPKATIIHFGGGSEISTEEKQIKVLKGQATLMRVHWGPLAQRFGYVALILMSGLRAIASRFMYSPERPGAGADGRRDIWPAVFRRRNEWLKGWF